MCLWKGKDPCVDEKGRDQKGPIYRLEGERPERTHIFQWLPGGVWRCSIKMAAEDKLDASLTAFTLPEHVSLVVYGSRGVQGPLQLQDSSRDLFLLGQTDQFDVSLADRKMA